MYSKKNKEDSVLGALSEGGEWQKTGHRKPETGLLVPCRPRCTLGRLSEVIHEKRMFRVSERAGFLVASYIFRTLSDL